MFILVISLIITYIRLSVKLWTGTKTEGKSELRSPEMPTMIISINYIDKEITDA